MRYKLLLLCFLSISISMIHAQEPSQVVVLPAEKDAVCTGTQDPGTINTIIPDVTNVGSEVSFEDTTFLCFGDGALVDHNNDFVLDGDPDPTTLGEVGYAIYSCQPTIGGTDLVSIVGDGCVINTPPTPNDIYVYQSIADTDADLQLFNDGGVNTLFSEGSPTLYYFAPITFDAENANGNVVYENGGSCVRVNILDAFRVIYLNEIQERNASTLGLRGDFVLEGGYPEWNAGANYVNIDIINTTNPGITGTVLSSGGHGDQVEIEVPEEGTYTITISDGKSCPYEFEMTFSNSTLSFEIGMAEVELGDTFCVPITVTNFDSIVGFQLFLNFNSNIITFLDIQNWAIPAAAPFPNFISADQGRIGLLWTSNNLTEGTNLPDGTVLFELCFTTANNAGIGDMTDISVADRPSSLVNFPNVELPANVRAGKVTIVGTDLIGVAKSCGSLPGRTDGTLEVFVYEGMPPYNVSIEEPISAFTDAGTVATDGGSIEFINLPPGDYNIRISDAGMDTYNFVHRVYDGSQSAPPQPRPQFNIIEVAKPSCVTSSDGSIAIDYPPNFIASPYDIEWSNAVYNSDTISNLTQGTYLVTVTDNFGCEQSRSYTLSQSPVELEANVTNASCSGYTNGSAILTASGGTPTNGTEYTFSWETGRTTGTQANLTNLSSGWHYVTIQDANACRTLDSFFVSADRSLFLESLLLEDPACEGDSTGSIRIVAGTRGGSENLPYTITVENSIGATVGMQTANDSYNALNLPAGVYDILIQDNTMPDACEFDTSIRLNDPDPITFSVDEQAETCPPGSNNGIVTVNVEGGTAPYQFTWSNALGDSNTHTNLNPDTYFFTITDDNGCMESGRATVDPATPPRILSVDETPPSCPDSCDGFITIRVEPNPDFEIVSYLIRRGSGPAIEIDTNATTLVVDGYCGGDVYQVREVTDAAGCVATDPSFATFEDLPSLTRDTFFTRNPSCVGRSDGRISIHMVGATSPYTFNWSNGFSETQSDSSAIANLPEGTYSVTVSDANRCSALEYQFTISDPPELTATFTDIQATSCYETCDGEAMGEAMGGQSGGNYSFTWSSGTTGNGLSSMAVNLCPGDQYVIIDDGACVDTFSVFINAPDSIAIASAALTEPSCFGRSDGQIEVQADGGAGGYSYQWENGPASERFDNLSAGEYVLSITDANNCTRIDTYFLSQPDSLVAEFLGSNIMNPSCPGDSDGSLLVNVSGGATGTYSYEWSNTNSTEARASSLSDGIYRVIVRDENNCIDSAEAELRTVPITIVLPEVDTPLCFDGTTPYTISIANGGNGGPFMYRIGASEFVDMGQAVDIPSGELNITIVDQLGCSLDTSIIVPQRDRITIDLPSEIELRLGQTATLVPVVRGPDPFVSYLWTPTDGIACDTCRSTTALPTINTLYTLQVTDVNGCTATGEVFIELNTQRDIFIPNIFTPNGDGANDVFQVFAGPGVRQIQSFQVFDRWGSLVWEGNNLLVTEEGSPGWDGTFKGRPLDPAVFVYQISIEFLDGRVITYRGDVTMSTGIPK